MKILELLVFGLLGPFVVIGTLCQRERYPAGKGEGDELKQLAE